MPTADAVTALIKESELAPEHLEVLDTSDGCGAKFEALIVSTAFDGMGLLERQRAVNALLPMDEIHAFSMKCKTPAQYAKMIAS